MPESAVGKARLHVTFPGHLASEPILHRVASEFGLVTNIRRANIDDRGGWVIVEVAGGDELTGSLIVRRALEEPMKQIAANAGLEGGVVIEKVRGLDVGTGLNAATGEYEDMFKAGIIDPTKVTRSALQNAASIAALFLTTEAVVAEKPEKEKAPPMPGGGDMDF